MAKITAKAPANIAFIKYWGRKNEKLKLPANGSISMNLSNLITTTSVEFREDLKQDIFILNNEPATDNSFRKVSMHLDRIRSLAGISNKAEVISANNFPRGTGLSSSASGFAALTLAAAKAAGLDLTEKELSILARQGSGSACRSIPDGFVEWLDGDSSETAYAYSIFPPDYWDIVDIVCILTTEIKDVSTTEGQKIAKTSPFYKLRLENIKNKIEKIKKYIKERSFNEFGELVEAEALELHAIMLTSSPSLIYWHPATVTVMKAVQKWRTDGLPVYFTLNTGQNIHLICEEKNADEVEKRVKMLAEVQQVIFNRPTEGARIVS